MGVGVTRPRFPVGRYGGAIREASTPRPGAGSPGWRPNAAKRVPSAPHPDRSLVQNPGDHGSLTQFLRRVGLRHGPARGALRGTAQPALRGRLALPGLRRAAGAHHQRRAADPAAPAPPGRHRGRAGPQRARAAALPQRRPGRADRRGVAPRPVGPGLDHLPGTSGPAARRPPRAGRRRDQAAHTFRVHTGHTDVPAVRLAGGGRADRPPGRRGLAPADPAQRAAAVRRRLRALALRRRAGRAAHAGAGRPSARPGSGASG